VFQKFTDRARQVVGLAQDEARSFHHRHIGTEHLLLGLISEGQGVAGRALAKLGISLSSVRYQVEQVLGRGDQPSGGYLPFTPNAKSALERALHEARQAQHAYIGTEHILLGLIVDGRNVAALVLDKLGAEPDDIRAQITELLAGDHQERELTPPAEPAPIVAAVPAGDDDDPELAELRRRKDQAVDAENFELAAALRDEEKELLRRRASAT
jgi:ATP-dependent Clp protease ATP-binding subunit ClpC